MASMVAYPLLTTAQGKKIYIRSKRQLLSVFSQIFDAQVECVIVNATEKDIWGNWQGFTIDGGAVWFDGIIPPKDHPDIDTPGHWTKYPLKIITVNNDSPYDCKLRPK